MESTGSN
jgi:hypothetical protein